MLPSPAAMAQVVTAGRFTRPPHLNLLSDRLVDLVTHNLPIEEFAQGLEIARERRGHAVKVSLTP